MNIDPPSKLKVVICWTHISGFFSACCRQLTAAPNIDLLVVAFAVESRETSTAFESSLMAGVNCRLLDPADRADADQMRCLVRSLVIDFQPDIVVFSGWAVSAYVNLANEPALAGARFIMTMDTLWRGTWRQRLGRLKIRRVLSRLDRVLVPGERSWQFARRLGVPEAKIRRGMYSVDYELVKPILSKRLQLSATGWPRRFLYVGRYVHDKAIDVLVAGYAAYRRATPNAWPLTCCGAGPLAPLIHGAEGIEDRGFVKPGDLPGVLLDHGVFVIASRFDPWPVTLVEAAGAGLPIVASEACGSAVELVRQYYNGLVIPTGDVAALAAALQWMHRHVAEAPTMGGRGQSLAAPYSAEAWSARMLNYFAELLTPLNP